MDKNKLALPAAILIASLILGGFFYAIQVNKQQSIERQQQIKLQEDRRQQEAKLQDDRRTEEVKAERDKRDYIAERKMECYEMFRDEQKRVSNAENYGYSENYNLDGTPDYRDDTCEIVYKNTETGKYFREYY